MEALIQTELITQAEDLPVTAAVNGTRPVGRPKGPGTSKTPRPSLEKKPFIRDLVSQHANAIPLPLELRDALQLKRGDTVVLWKDHDTILMRKITLEIKVDELIIRS